jgi:hypothetical protein
MALIDAGWAAWLPYELSDAYDALRGGSVHRRRLRDRLRVAPDLDAEERWERFRLAAPSRIDVPVTADGLTEERCYALLIALGLAVAEPVRAVEAPEAVELVLSLDHDELRELERVRAARADATPPDDFDLIVAGLQGLPSLANVFGKDVGRNDPCPCGSGKKFKRCHGSG